MVVRFFFFFWEGEVLCLGGICSFFASSGLVLKGLFFFCYCHDLLVLCDRCWALSRIRVAWVRCVMGAYSVFEALVKGCVGVGVWGVGRGGGVGCKN